MTLKISLATKYEIVDPYTAINKIGSYDQAVYMELQLALREIVGNEPIDRLLKQRTKLNQTLQELWRPGRGAIRSQTLISQHKRYYVSRRT